MRVVAEMTGVDRGPGPLVMPLCVLHAIPLRAMSGRVQLDIATAHEDFLDLIAWSGSTGRRTNLDGLIVYPNEIEIDGRRALPGHTQLFRSGAIEATWTGRALATDEPYIPSTTVTVFYRRAIDMAVSSLRKRGLTGPAIIAGTFLRVSGYKFGIDTGRFPFVMNAITKADRADLPMPEAWIDDVAVPLANVDDVARPMVDVLWQAFGQLRCLEYTPDGRFRQ